jgi:hypothetical protein
MIWIYPAMIFLSLVLADIRFLRYVLGIEFILLYVMLPIFTLYPYIEYA